MSCDKFNESLSSYLDDQLSKPVREFCDDHLAGCPVCRSQLALTRRISRGLGTLSVADMPGDLAADISNRLAIEAAAQKRLPDPSVIRTIERWLRPRLMPYSVGAFASTLLFFGIISALRPHFRALHDAEVAIRASDGRFSMLAASDAWEYDITRPVSSEGLAAIRAPYGVESPSLNPKGALAALTWAPNHHHSGDDDMVIVTDVFTDGRASIADIVQAPRDKEILEDFQDALRENAAFVPASYDQRPQTLRVVFMFQRVDVREGNF